MPRFRIRYALTFRQEVSFEAKDIYEAGRLAQRRASVDADQLFAADENGGEVAVLTVHKEDYHELEDGDHYG